MKSLWMMTLVAGTCLPVSAWAAGFADTNQSATATALGGVGVANPNEANRSYYNPASMTEAKFGVYLGDVITVPNITYEAPNGDESETISDVLPPPNFHAGYRFGEAFAVGVGFTRPYGLTIEWPDDWAGREIVVKQTLRTFNINPNLAYRFPGTKFSLSIGAQLVPADVTFERRVILRSDDEVEVELGGTALGYGATASVFYRPTLNLTVGASYRSGVDLDFEGDAHFAGEEGTPFEQTFVDQSVSTHLTLPDSVTFGIGYQADKVWVGFDVAVTFWSSFDTLELKFSEPCQAGDQTCDAATDSTNPPTTTIPQDWEDSATLRLGLQYDVLEYLQLRAGVAWDMSPIPDSTVSPSLPGNDRAVVSAGVGFHRAEWRVDLAYQLVKAGRTIENGNQDGRYSSSAQIFGLNLGYEY